MINHHPKFELIKAFVNGDLPASLSAGVAIHADMCPVCQQTIAQFTEQVAETSFEEEYLDRFIVDDNEALDAVAAIDFDHMIDEIVQSSDISIALPKVEKTISFDDKTYTIPTALNSMELGKHAHIGKLTRARIQLNENEIHTSLLHIQPGGGVPEHTHKGFELTVLLAGSFHDESGEYVKGDFIMLDSSHQHHPISTNGCLCYTVANDALHFTQGINKLLNPIGSFIY
jgi:putative transcriptional regulator